MTSFLTTLNDKFFDLWSSQFENFMSHIHCYNFDWDLAYQNIFNDAFTMAQYGIFAGFFFWVASWGVKGGNWRPLFVALAFVFIFCGLNYGMMIWVIFEPVYYLQTFVKYIGNMMFMKASYHLFKIGRTPLIAIVNAVKKTVKDGRF